MFHQKSDNDKCKIIQIEPGVFGLLSRDVEHGPIYWNNVLDKFKDYQGYIFNLGHGITPNISPDKIKLLTDHIRSR